MWAWPIDDADLVNLASCRYCVAYQLWCGSTLWVLWGGKHCVGVYYNTQHTNKRGVQQIAANLPPETSRQVSSKYMKCKRIE